MHGLGLISGFSANSSQPSVGPALNLGSSTQAIHWIGPVQRGPIGIVLFPREWVRVWDIENKREKEDLASSLLRSISSPGPPLLCGVVAESGER